MTGMEGPRNDHLLLFVELVISVILLVGRGIVFSPFIPRVYFCHWSDGMLCSQVYHGGMESTVLSLLRKILYIRYIAVCSILKASSVWLFTAATTDTASVRNTACFVTLFL